jgi:ribosome recycling factor
MPVKEIINQHRSKMEKAVQFLADELKAARTGRASTTLVENIKVEYYGSPTLLKQLASLAAPQADTIVIKPFDPASIKEIEKAIKNSDLSIAPIVDGKIIRLNIPPLSEERRRQIVNQVKQNGEQAKISIRNIRHDGLKELQRQEDAKLITEDDHENGKKQFDELTKEYTNKIENLVKTKSDEIMKD